MRISDWSSDVCSSDLGWPAARLGCQMNAPSVVFILRMSASVAEFITQTAPCRYEGRNVWTSSTSRSCGLLAGNAPAAPLARYCSVPKARTRSEEHTSELQSLMRISYAVFCLKKKKNKKHNNTKN